MSFTIPHRNTVQVTSFTPLPHEQELLKSIPQELHATANRRLALHNEERKEKEQMANEASAMYLKNLMETHREVMAAIESGLKIGRDLDYAFEPAYTGAREWHVRNHGPSDAITYIEQELRSKGWQPFQHFNASTKKMHLKCSFAALREMY